jgi:hypothetical protein
MARKTTEQRTCSKPNSSLYKEAIRRLVWTAEVERSVHKDRPFIDILKAMIQVQNSYIIILRFTLSINEP